MHAAMAGDLDGWPSLPRRVRCCRREVRCCCRAAGSASISGMRPARLRRCYARSALALASLVARLARRVRATGSPARGRRRRSPSSRRLPPRQPRARRPPPPLIEYLEEVTGGADRNEALPARHRDSRARRPARSRSRVCCRAPTSRCAHRAARARAVRRRLPWLPLQQALASDDVGQGILRAAAALAAAIERVAAERPTRGKAIVTGFSQGGALTFALALHHPRVVGAAFPMGGWVPRGAPRRSAAAPALRRSSRSTARTIAASRSA